ncbi:2-keto-3-deoxy-L-fuconate dehydrogenase [Pelagimonas phthalicica]|uniref:2-keto-3-deoxy-L-fuconate dehydrogenase n=1 Tax=Pelagimonas phthalicica TaxID=1037362 RepID=A0A238JGF9_9RHOB|nr:SDR family oxidoreductase [Pelagimonas phthalicica]TDS92223.1 2-keto-3-deoxy-L-fuconate dehydrogenase [Pelagimonas phthalicica]SMX29284.1 2-keto-3-deoxy-L-fuconate dehydrogenase [Pelagimonas phthalicica]
MRLQGKTVLATASAQGIGRATVERMAAEGARVFASDINTGPLDGVSGLEVLNLNVTDPQAIQHAVDKIGAVDVLFNCVGMVHGGTILEASEAEMDQAFAVNVKSMFHTIRAVLPGMIARGNGAIVNVASVASSITGVPNRMVYGTTKAAVIGLTKSVAADYVQQGVRANAICPGTVDSPSLHERLRATGDYEQAWADFNARQKLGRVGQPEEIAALACYLASDEAAFTTGQVMNIDGGWTI